MGDLNWMVINLNITPQAIKVRVDCEINDTVHFLYPSVVTDYFDEMNIRFLDQAFYLK